MIEELLVPRIFALLIIFARLGAATISMPGIGEAYINVRSRLMIGLAFSVLLLPILEPRMPPIPDSPITLLVLITQETIIGVCIGMVGRIIMGALHTAGTIMSMQSNLAMAMQFDPTQNTQGSVVGNFISLCVMLMIFLLDLHHLMLRALADSYTLFDIGNPPPIGDFSEYIVRLVGDVFLLSIHLSAPAIVIGLIINIGGGILARLMPTLQIFFILMPIQIYIGFAVLIAAFASIMFEFTEYFTDTITAFLDLGAF